MIIREGFDNLNESNELENDILGLGLGLGLRLRLGLGLGLTHIY